MVFLKNAIFKRHLRAAILGLANYLQKNKAEQYIGSGIS
jgi:hypothetical protein